jgi:molecular chaperone GrpE (heat shock protein)
MKKATMSKEEFAAKVAAEKDMKADVSRETKPTTAPVVEAPKTEAPKVDKPKKAPKVKAKTTAPAETPKVVQPAKPAEPKPETPAEKLARLEKEIAEERKARKNAEAKAQLAEQEKTKVLTALNGDKKSLLVSDIAHVSDSCKVAMQTVEQRGKNIKQFTYAVLCRTDKYVIVLDASDDPIAIPISSFNEDTNTIRDRKGISFDYYLRPTKKAIEEQPKK